ncbi:MAG: diphthine synthase [Nitrososphaerota archaeon]|nr:diphthine synthase [Candidatus Calditenuaceae archaeon]MDW8073843.1 diphthine synthase [Nitrososphaerota archaeon]
MVLRLVGLGLGPPDYMTFKAMKALEASEVVYLDSYTSPLPGELVEFLRSRLGERLRHATRADLEDKAVSLVEMAAGVNVAVAVIGDPLVATTHITLLAEAASRGVEFEVVYGVSSISAAIGASCLSSYRFGRTTTVPREASGESLKTIYRNVEENLEAGLHTLLLLDVAGDGLSASEAVERLLAVGAEMGGRFKPDSLVVVLARLGYGDELRAACRASQVKSLHLPPPPHTVIIPAQLRSYEKEAIAKLMKAGEELLAAKEAVSSRRVRAERYLAKASGALARLKVVSGDAETRRVLEIASSYLEDARFFLNSQMLDDALIAVSYAEGLLDSLRILGKVEFSW